MEKGESDGADIIGFDILYVLRLYVLSYCARKVACVVKSVFNIMCCSPSYHLSPFINNEEYSQKR